MLDSEQTDYVFILGKNWKLSLAELVSYLDARNYCYKVSKVATSFSVIENLRLLDKSIIEDLGGTIKIGKIIAQIPLEALEHTFLQKTKKCQRELEAELANVHVSGEKFKKGLEKNVFGISLYIANPRFTHCAKKMHRFMGSFFKKRLKSEGIKANFLGFPTNRTWPQLTHVEVIKKRLIEKSFELMFCVDKEQAFVAETIAVHNPFEFQKRDVQRPVQRKIFSIPPRLAKIMVNLAQCKPGKVLLDPFCGVGTILQEALLLKAHVVGVDINPWCVKAASTNLEWLVKGYGLKDAAFKVFVGDARKLSHYIDMHHVDCIVTEPNLGPALRHFPTKSFAEKLVSKLKPLYSDFLEEAQKVLKRDSRLVIVTPYVRTRQGSFVGLDIEETSERNGFRSVNVFEDHLAVAPISKSASFTDVEKRHKIGREIHVLKKM
ncbi:MAG: DNA methyltransferase [Candidatus Bathyarchaeia archaeon]